MNKEYVNTQIKEKELNPRTDFGDIKCFQTVGIPLGNGCGFSGNGEIN